VGEQRQQTTAVAWLDIWKKSSRFDYNAVSKVTPSITRMLLLLLASNYCKWSYSLTYNINNKDHLILDLFKKEDLLMCFLDAGRNSNANRSLDLIASEHPDVDPCIADILQSRAHILE
jgi:hypothetical protein